MFEQALLPPSAGLELAEVSIGEATIILKARSTQETVLCPNCQQPSERVHSRYGRTAADLPCAGYRVQLELLVRRFFCDNATCPRKTFAERFSPLLAPFARRTSRLAEQQRQTGLDLGGEAGARLLARIAMPTSGDTVLRLVRSTSSAATSSPRIVGVDDWAWRKGHRYGTILVDLERHCPVDLLPDRTAEMLEQWLREHPGVEVVSRDRAQAYIDGIRRGAPAATQVADRWHLLRNLKDALERLLEQNRACLSAVAMEKERSPEPVSTGSPPETQKGPPLLTKAEQGKQATRDRRLARYQAVVALHQRGLKIQDIAHQTGLDRRTIQHYLAVGTFPEMGQRKRHSRRLEPHVAYLQRRWAEGCHNGAQLYRELQQRGYAGSRSLLGDWVARQRKQGLPPAPEGIPQPPPPAPPPWSARRAVWLLMKDPITLEPEEDRALERMLTASYDVRRAYHFGQAFMQIIRQRIAKALDSWLMAVRKYKVAGLEGFGQSLEQDKVAVLAALTLPWSNGQVEGQVNRLKLIKRQMYGRANFDLLRVRVLHYGGP